MLNVYDQEKVIEARHSSGFLVKDLRSLAISQHPLLAQICCELLQQALELEKKMKRLESAVQQRSAVTDKEEAQ